MASPSACNFTYFPRPNHTFHSFLLGPGQYLRRARRLTGRRKSLSVRISHHLGLPIAYFLLGTRRSAEDEASHKPEKKWLSTWSAEWK